MWLLLLALIAAPAATAVRVAVVQHAAAACPGCAPADVISANLALYASDIATAHAVRRSTTRAGLWFY